MSVPRLFFGTSVGKPWQSVGKKNVCVFCTRLPGASSQFHPLVSSHLLEQPADTRESSEQSRPILSQSRTLSIQESFHPGTIWEVKLLKQEHTRASNLNSNYRLLLKRTPTRCSHTHTWGFLQLFIQIQIQIYLTPRQPQSELHRLIKAYVDVSLIRLV